MSVEIRVCPCCGRTMDEQEPDCSCGCVGDAFVEKHDLFFCLTNTQVEEVAHAMGLTVTPDLIARVRESFDREEVLLGIEELLDEASHTCECCGMLFTKEQSTCGDCADGKCRASAILIPEHDPEFTSTASYPGGIRPGIYRGNALASLLRNHKHNPEAVQFIADMMEV